MSDDEEQIKATVHDYFEGWYDGDAARMERALHRDLVKRAPREDQSLGITTAAQMIDFTAKGEGKAVAAAHDRTIEVDVLDVYDDIATALVRSAPYHEYLHLVRTRDGWRIANALWRPT